MYVNAPDGVRVKSEHGEVKFGMGRVGGDAHRATSLEVDKCIPAQCVIQSTKNTLKVTCLSQEQTGGGDLNQPAKRVSEWGYLPEANLPSWTDFLPCGCCCVCCLVDPRVILRVADSCCCDIKMLDD